MTKLVPIGRHEETGATLVEYALLLVLIATLSILALNFVGNSTSNSFGSSGNGFNGAQSSVVNGPPCQGSDPGNGQGQGNGNGGVGQGNGAGNACH